MRQHKFWLSLVVLVSLLTASCVQPSGSTDSGAEGGTAEKATIEFWFNPPSGGEGANCVVEKCD